MATACRCLALLWLENWEGRRQVCGWLQTRAVELQGPLGVRRAAKGVLSWCPAAASRSSPKGGTAELKLLKRGWIRPASENQNSAESWGDRWQAELDPNKSQSQPWDSLACREADPWRCWHCLRTLWTELSTENLHSSNWKSLLL